MGFTAGLIAIPILADPDGRARLFKGLIWAGLAIGLWGIVQWTVDIPFTASEDAGVRAGVRFTTTGRGQIQGGLFAFPVAVAMSAAALLSQEIRSASTRLLLIAILGDLPDVTKTGTIFRERYEDAKAEAQIGFTLEWVGAVLLILSAGLLLLADLGGRPSGVRHQASGPEPSASND